MKYTSYTSVHRSPMSQINQQ